MVSWFIQASIGILLTWILCCIDVLYIPSFSTFHMVKKNSYTPTFLPDRFFWHSWKVGHRSDSYPKYPSSYNHGSEEWILPITFQTQPFSTSMIMGERVNFILNQIDFDQVMHWCDVKVVFCGLICQWKMNNSIFKKKSCFEIGFFR